MRDKTTEINFPLVNISQRNWKSKEAPEYFHYDGYYYSMDYIYFKSNVVNDIYCDCNGNLFQPKELIPPAAYWRKIFFFLPNVYKQKIIYENLNRHISVEELREFLMARVSELYKENKLYYYYEWKEHLKKANNYEGLIDGQVVMT